MKEILIIIVLALFAISLLIAIVKSLGKSEGYKEKTLEIQIEELRLKIIEADNRNMHLEKVMLSERTQKSNILVEIFKQTLYDSYKTPEEKVAEMLHNDSILYKKEEI